MGVAITSLLKKHEINISQLKGKTLTVDAFNMLYQFLTTIRSRDGTPLTDSKGNITSHLIGLFSRTTNLLSQGLKLVFIFDGISPELKKAEQERRSAVKKDAKAKFDAAKAIENIDDMKKYAGRTARLTNEMIKESKELLDYLGIPHIQALSEGEAQAAYMVKKKDAYAVISQDADALLFGATKVIRNIGVAGKRKKRSALVYEKIMPERIELEETLNVLGIDHDHLIVLAILVGTDFNPGGIKGLGPKKALKLVKEVNDIEKIFEIAEWDKYFDFSWKEVFKIFKEMPMIDDYKLRFGHPDKEKIIDFLVNKHEFSLERVENSIKKIIDNKEKNQKGLSDFF